MGRLKCWWWVSACHEGPSRMFAQEKHLTTDTWARLLHPSRLGLGNPWRHPLLRASIHCGKHQTDWQTVWSRHVLQDQHTQPCY